MPAQISEPAANRRPVNQAALPWLQQSPEPVDPTSPYLLQLMWAGFEAGLEIPGPGQAYRYSLEEQLAASLDQFKTVAWLLANPNGPDPEEQEAALVAELDQARDWRQAAQRAMEAWYSRHSAANSHYQPAENL